jgi:hypothetical protein
MAAGRERILVTLLSGAAAMNPNPNNILVASHYGQGGGGTLYFTDDAGVRCELYLPADNIPTVADLLTQCLSPSPPPVSDPIADGLAMIHGLVDRISSLGRTQGQSSPGGPRVLAQRRRQGPSNRADDGAQSFRARVQSALERIEANQQELTMDVTRARAAIEQQTTVIKGAVAFIKTISESNQAQTQQIADLKSAIESAGAHEDPGVQAALDAIESSVKDNTSLIATAVPAILQNTSTTPADAIAAKNEVADLPQDAAPQAAEPQPQPQPPQGGDAAEKTGG